VHEWGGQAGLEFGAIMPCRASVCVDKLLDSITHAAYTLAEVILFVPIAFC
jgi:hypothetical protein